MTFPIDAISATVEAVWLDVSVGFQYLAAPLMNTLCHSTSITTWRYSQMPDAPSSLDLALQQLHNYLCRHTHTLHLVGHGQGGLLGLLYARRYPARVRSLTLLGVGVNPAIDWTAHYYTQLERLPCKRQHILTQMVYMLFGHQAKPLLGNWIKLLETELAHSLSPHSLVQRVSVCPGGVSVPLLICGSEDDAVVAPYQIKGWESWFKPGDRYWLCPNGRHFFYAEHPDLVAAQMVQFWQKINNLSHGTKISTVFHDSGKF